jgi:hypothetical protein
MTNLLAFTVDRDLEDKVEESRTSFHQARTEYELAMRREILHRVDHCPGCFDGFFEETKLRIQKEMCQGNFEPDVMEVLSLMSFTPVVRHHETQEDDVSLEAFNR